MGVAASAAVLFVAGFSAPALADTVPGSESVVRPEPARSLDTVGLFDPATAEWYLRDPAGATTSFSFGGPGTLPLAGDWNGDGVDSPGIYRPSDGLVALRNSSSSGPPNLAFFLPSDGIPVAADTDGDGRDAVSIVHNNRIVLGDGGADVPPARLADRVEAVAAGDTDGDGRDEIWTMHSDGWMADGRPAAGPVLGNDPRPVAGDFDGDGQVTFAVFRPWSAEFWVLHDSGDNPPTTIVPYGSSHMEPVAGNFGWLPGSDEAPPRLLGIPALAQGDEGIHVSRLQVELARRGLYRGPIDGVYGDELATSVIGFHQATRQERTGDWTDTDSVLLPSFRPDALPDRPDEPDRIEVDIGRQLLFLYQDGEVSAIVPVSSGGAYTYFSERQGELVRAGTPRGDFTLFRYNKGWQCDPVTGWCVYNYWAFTTYYGVHGYRSVPAYPASHGCVRVNTWDADWLESQFFIGMPIHVWDETPDV
jgi:hypothetical protein